jgi:Bardet-Biedl syndrome 5 protein
MPKKNTPLSPSVALNLVEWRRKECRFDRPISEILDFNHGEVIIDSLNDVEDTKGNNGQSGRLIVTNLRVIW